MDPNWFYSSLAQATAAILGIVGGFLVSALIRQREFVEIRRKPLLEAARYIADLCDQLAAQYRGIAGWLVNDVDLDEEAMTADVAVVMTVTGEGGPGAKGLRVSAKDVSMLKELGRYSSNLGQNLLSPFWLLTGNERTYSRVNIALMNMHAWQGQQENHWSKRADALSRLASGGMAELWELLYTFRVYHSALARARNAILPRSLYWAVVLMMFLATTGLLLPLSQLSSYSDDGRSLYLVASTLGVYSLILFVALQMILLRNSVVVTPNDVRNERDLALAAGKGYWLRPNPYLDSHKQSSSVVSDAEKGPRSGESPAPKK